MAKTNSNRYKILAVICSVVATTAIGYLIVWAGSLNPPSTPADTMYTLDDIYHRLDKDAGATSSWGLDPSSNPTSTMHTLEDIYNKTPDFRTNPGTAVVGDVCNSATFYKNSATKLTGTRTACSNPSLPDTGQTKCYNAAGTEITCGTAPVGQDAEYTSANSFTCDPSFTDNGDGTITDNCTGLMWKTCSEGQTYGAGPVCTGDASTFTWVNALSQCEGLNYAGHSDWRLPNAKELLSIVNYQNSDPAINTTYFPATAAYHYWSSTTLVGLPNSAWRVHFFFGYMGNYYKSDSYHVRCVRGR